MLEHLRHRPRENNVGAMVRFARPRRCGQIHQVREMLKGQAALMIPLPVSKA